MYPQGFARPVNSVGAGGAPAPLQARTLAPAAHDPRKGNAPFLQPPAVSSSQDAPNGSLTNVNVGANGARGLTGSVGSGTTDLGNSCASVGQPKSAPSNWGVVLERRLAWLEEDFQVTERRLRDTFGFASDAASAGENESLQALCTRIEGDLVEERQWREGLESQITHIEASLSEERTSRGQALQTLSVDLDNTMKQLVARIDSGISAETNMMKERARNSEAALHNLIARVEDGLAHSAKALEDSLTQDPQRRENACPQDLGSSSQAQAPPWNERTSLPIGAVQSRSSSSAPTRPERDEHLKRALNGNRAAAPAEMIPGKRSPRNSLPPSRDEASPVASAVTATPGAVKLLEATEPLLKIWGKLQEENTKLRHRREQLAARAPGARSVGCKSRGSRGSDDGGSRDSPGASGVCSPVSTIGGDYSTSHAVGEGRFWGPSNLRSSSSQSLGIGANTPTASSHVGSSFDPRVAQQVNAVDGMASDSRVDADVLSMTKISEGRSAQLAWQLREGAPGIGLHNQMHGGNDRASVVNADSGSNAVETTLLTHGLGAVGGTTASSASTAASVRQNPVTEGPTSRLGGGARAPDLGRKCPGRPNDVVNSAINSGTLDSLPVSSSMDAWAENARANLGLKPHSNGAMNGPVLTPHAGQGVLPNGHSTQLGPHSAQMPPAQLNRIPANNGMIGARPGGVNPASSMGGMQGNCMHAIGGVPRVMSGGYTLKR